jgi:hypothetical protein
LGLADCGAHYEDVRMKVAMFFVGTCLVWFASSFVYAKEADDAAIKETIQSFYSANEKSLLCYTQEGGIDASLIRVPRAFFSQDFMDRYRSVCLGKAGFVLSFDIRTGDPDIFIVRGYRPVVRKIIIGTPSIDGPRATVKVTYDLERAPFKEWGNFSKYKFVKEDGKWKIDDIQLGGTGQDRESLTAMPSIPSLRQYIDDNIRKVEKKR